MEELKAKLDELINQAESLPEGPGQLMVLSYLKDIRSTIDSVIRRREILETETHGLVEG